MKEMEASMRLFTFIIIVGLAFSVYAQSGPGGIGNSDGSGSQPENSLWLRADSITGISNGASVASWLDVSGNSNNASQGVANRQPLFITNELNGNPVVRFDGLDTLIGDYLTVNDADDLDDTDGLSVITIVKPQNVDEFPRGLLSKRENTDVNTSYSQFFIQDFRLYTDIADSPDRFKSSAMFTNGSWYMTELIYDGTLLAAERSKFFMAGTSDTVHFETNTSIPNTTSDLNIGLLTNVAGEYTLAADIAEIIIYRNTLNDAQRVIIENYLSAKYGITVSNDLYAGDAPINGDLDYGMIGIGQDSTGSHDIAQVDGLVLDANTFLVDYGDYALAGHNSGTNSSSSADLPASIQDRWSRIWYIDRTDGGASANGTITLGFDFGESGIGSTPVGLASYYQLLYRSGTTGNFSIVTVSNASIVGDQVLFDVSDANLTDGYYTLGRQDNPPTVASAIADVEVSEDAINKIIDLTNVFTDVDNDDNDISKSVQNNSNSSLVSASILNNTLTLDFQANQFGAADITIRGTSNGLFVDDVFHVTVNPEDDAPIVASPIADVPAFEDDDDVLIDLSTVFTDIDNDDELITKALQGNSNPTLVVATVIGNDLTLEFQPEQSGVASIAIRGTSNGKFVDDAFEVNVAIVDDAPRVAFPILDVNVVEDAANTPIDLTGVFTDIDNIDALITKTVQNNTNPTLVSASITDNILTLDYQQDQFGIADITIRGTSNGLFVQDTFKVTVTAENDAPTISDIVDQGTAEDTPTGAIPFTVNDVETAAGSLTVSGVSDNQALIPDENIVFGGSGTSRTVTITPLANQSGTATITVTVSDGDLTANDTFELTVTAENDAPTISDIVDQGTVEDTPTSAIPFTVNDVETAPGSLTVSGVSDNQTLIPDGNIVFGGSGTDRTVTITPAANQNGTATITVTVSDGDLTANDTFELTVTGENDAPTISDVADQGTTEDTPTGSIAVTVNDTESDPATLLLTGSSDNQTLVPNENIVLGGTGTSRTVVITPAANQSGTATITLTVNDGDLTATDTFEFTVTAENDAPTISDIFDQSTPEDTPTDAIAFIVNDIESDPTTLTVSGSSDNQDLLPDANIVFGGSGTNRTVVLTPLADQNGTATITIEVSDGDLTATDTFLLTVDSENDPPVISDLVDQIFNEDDSLVYSITDLWDLVTDPDHPDNMLTFLPIGEPEHVFIEVDLPNLILKAPANWFGFDTLQIVVIDPEFAADTATIYIEVKSVNDIPYFSELPDSLELIVETEDMLTMSDYAMDNDLPDDNLTWDITSSPEGLQLQFDPESTDLTITAPDVPGRYMVRVSVTDDSLATAVDSFEVIIILDPSSVADLTNGIPVSYSLEQNYPNPFNPTTHIKYGLPYAGEVLVEVYNLLGQKIVTLFDSYQSAGYHVLEFDASNLPSGIYFYRIQSKEFQSIKKMMLIK